MAAAAAEFRRFSYLLLIIFNLLLLPFNSSSAYHLSKHFYSKTCPNALSTIKTAVHNAVNSDPGTAAALLHLHFRDCFINGCDGSVLLVNTTNPMVAPPRGLNVIVDIKTQLEELCVGVVSCADILTLATRDAIVVIGGPSWSVSLGRRDSTTPSKDAGSTIIPGPASNLTHLISSFANKGFTARQMVALSGSHTIGKAHCAAFRNRIYNDSDIDASYAAWLRSKCPQSGGDLNYVPLDITTPILFDNAYFKNLQSQKGLLHSDQQLLSSGFTNSIVKEYISHPSKFANDFAEAMVKMSELSPLTGTNGEIRRDCRRMNY
ncbi:PREDICTED: peroxidase P7-like isoform X1 [Ipomoea nil]|uniref:peroxidase P7-like isoform X1 n=1 Tax=Ipomoea nil TaxID=35883 RepID=UPI000901A6DF|nr:PREDICTED: peroxidase P7-like isoform X1 [Ipomoea nil]